MSCIEIGVFVVCIGLAKLLWSCSKYIDRAKAAKDISCGLQVKTSMWGFNLGISGESGSNAKDHPPFAK